MIDDTPETRQPTVVDRIQRRLGVATTHAEAEHAEPDPWDDAPTGEPASGEEFVEGATFGADVESTDWYDVAGRPLPRRLPAPIVVRQEQPDVIKSRSYDLTADTPRQIAEANPRRMSIDVTVKSANVVYIAESQAAAPYGFPAETGYQWPRSYTTGEVWAETGTGQTIYVVEHFRSGLAQGHPIDLGGAG